MVCEMRFYTLVPRFSADPSIPSATIRWGLPRTGRRRFLSGQTVRQKVLASAFGFWLKSRATLDFPQTTSLVVLKSLFPVPQLNRYRHALLMSGILRHLPFILRSGAGMLSLRFRSLWITSKFFVWTLISKPHHVVNSCTTTSKGCIPFGVSAKIEMSSMKLMLLN